MKAKEFLNKIMHGDKTTIRKNTGLIGFDEKGNHIEDKGGEDIILLPSEFSEMLIGAPNPILSTETVGGFLLSKPEVESFVCTVDGITTEGRTGMAVITQEIVDTFPEGEARDYMAAHIGWYAGEAGAQNPETLTAGTIHAVTIIVNGVQIFSGNLTVVEL